MQTQMTREYREVGQHRRGTPRGLGRRWDAGVHQGAADPAQRRATGLGWFSIGLGLAATLAPGLLAERIGAGRGPKKDAATFAVGVRELLTGAGILAGVGRPIWLWARVAGDILDLALLG